MARTMSSHEARANFGDVVGSVYYTGEPVVIARKGKPMAVVVSPADFERWRALDGKPDGAEGDAARAQFTPITPD
ncbi:MAG: type II toxin-antitoxin system Phd/YefM family antitoxin [Thermomicrobiales bacterium]